MGPVASCEFIGVVYAAIVMPVSGPAGPENYVLSRARNITVMWSSNLAGEGDRPPEDLIISTS